jgi:hypothetical protein
LQPGLEYAPPEPPWWKFCFGYFSREVREFWDWEDRQLYAQSAIEVEARQVPEYDGPLTNWTVQQWIIWLGHPDKSGDFQGWKHDEQRKTIIFHAPGMRVICPQLIIDRVEFGRFVGDFEPPATFTKLGD